MLPHAPCVTPSPWHGLPFRPIGDSTLTRHGGLRGRAALHCDFLHRMRFLA